MNNLFLDLSLAWPSFIDLLTYFCCCCFVVLIGEVILLSSSPGTLMNRLSKHYGIKKISTIRASRVDYYTQHKISVWRNHLGLIIKL